MPRRRTTRPTAKGLRACELARRLLLKTAPWLTRIDITAKAGYHHGEDLVFTRARRWFPFYVEVKHRQNVDIFGAMEQAAEYGSPPLVFFKRDRTDLYVALRAEDFVKLLPIECPADPVVNPQDASAKIPR